MIFQDGDYVEFEERGTDGRLTVPARGHVVSTYTPPRNLGVRSSGILLIRIEVGCGGWDGQDGHYYWYVSKSKLRRCGIHTRPARPISPIFYHVKE